MMWRMMLSKAVVLPVSMMKGARASLNALLDDYFGQLVFWHYCAVAFTLVASASTQKALITYL